MTAPFDIQKVIEGQPVITVSGKPVGKLREVKYQNSVVKFLTALVDNNPVIWDYSGINMVGLDPGYNLVMDVPIVYHWVLTDKIKNKEPKDLTGFTKIIIP